MMNPSYKPILQPKPHQVTAVEQMKLSNMGNFHDQGLGKCKQAYDLAAQLIEKREIDLMLVISKSSLKDNFLNEIAKDATQLVPQVASGNRSQRRNIYRYPAYHVLIISYETALSDKQDLISLLKKNKVMLCLDEAHYIKNHLAQRSIACLELSRYAKRTTIFTGTPVPNNMEDLYTQMKFLGHDVGDTITEFKEKFGTIELFKAFLETRMIRLRKENVKDLNLPTKTISPVSVELSQQERELYDKLRDDMILEFKNKFGKISSIPITNILTQLLRLTQIASNPNLVLPGYNGPCSKLKKLDDLVTKILSDKKEKVIIWTGYRHNVRLLLEKYKQYNAVSIFGDISRDQIQENVKRFKSDSSCQILIAIPACAREGFTLTSAANAIYLDRNFSLLDWLQSQDRIHRISQDRKCNIYVLNAHDSIDEKIEEVLDRKDHLQRYLLGDESKYKAEENLTLNEVEALVGGQKKDS